MDLHQLTYPIMTVQPGVYYDKGDLGKYKCFWKDGIINMNPGDAEEYKMSGEEVSYHIIGVALAQQFILKAGLKRFVNPGGKASVEELNQIHDMKTFITLDPNNLTREDRIKSLSSLMFLVGKLDGTINSRTCSDGRKKRRD